MENHWGKAVDKTSQPRRRKAFRVIGEILASARALSTSPVDKPADSDVDSMLHALRCKRRKEFGQKLATKNV